MIAVSFSIIKIFVPSFLRKFGGNNWLITFLTASIKESDTRYGSLMTSDISINGYTVSSHKIFIIARNRAKLHMNLKRNKAL